MRRFALLSLVVIVVIVAAQVEGWLVMMRMFLVSCFSSVVTKLKYLNPSRKPFDLVVLRKRAYINSRRMHSRLFRLLATEPFIILLLLLLLLI